MLRFLHVRPYLYWDYVMMTTHERLQPFLRSRRRPVQFEPQSALDRWRQDTWRGNIYSHGKQYCVYRESVSSVCEEAQKEQSTLHKRVILQFGAAPTRQPQSFSDLSNTFPITDLISAIRFRSLRMPLQYPN